MIDANTTWIEPLRQQLAAIDVASIGNATTQVEVQSPLGTWRAELVSLDALACACRSIQLHLPEQRQWSDEQMQHISDDLSQRLTYLLEPIRVIEFDRDQHVLQMRSMPPGRDAQGTAFYELLVQPRRLALHRFSAGNGQPRQAIAMCFTREVLLRLVGDMGEMTA